MSPKSLDIFHHLFESAPDAILVIDWEGRITKVNTQAEKLFGYNRDELIGEFVEILMPERFTNGHIRHRNGYLTEPRARPMGVGLELFGKRKDESEFPLDIMLSPLDAGGVRFILCVVRDITERKRVEQRIIDSLHEKEVLLKEIHHRVKNNLAVISSLFYLQSTYTQDEQVLKIFQESQDRIRSMALVHEILYRSESFAAVDFAEYAQDLAKQLFQTYGLTTGKILLKTELEKIRMSMDIAIPCGLILNELISNAIKHAFPNHQGGEIRLRLCRKENNTCRIEVNDNGIGLPADLDIKSAQSLGLRLIRALTRQINGGFEFVRTDTGTQASLTLEVDNDIE
ncbi:MAG: histidine kinase dimerization/phosphoacceptor domain -containing protein [Acidobacteriota bacterium]